MKLFCLSHPYFKVELEERKRQIKILIIDKLIEHKMSAETGNITIAEAFASIACEEIMDLIEKDIIVEL